MCQNFGPEIPLSVSISVQSLSRIRLFATPCTAARQASLPITNSRSLLKLMSIESVMPSKHLILCRPLLLLPSIFPSIRVFSKESVRIRWPKYWSFSFSRHHFFFSKSISVGMNGITGSDYRRAHPECFSKKESIRSGKGHRPIWASL